MFKAAGVVSMATEGKLEWECTQNKTQCITQSQISQYQSLKQRTVKQKSNKPPSYKWHQLLALCVF
jgi:hypothetical protein